MGESEETRGVSDIRDHAKRYEMNLSRRLRGERERERCNLPLSTYCKTGQYRVTRKTMKEIKKDDVIDTETRAFESV